MPRELPWSGHPDAAARALLDSTYRQARLRRPERAPEVLPSKLGPDLAHYQAWLRKALPQSGLATQMREWAAAMPQKPDSFPDIYPALPGWLRWIERLRRPRSLPRMVSHVAYYLEWYAAPQSSARPDLHILKKLGPLGCYYCLHWPVVIGIIILLAVLGVLLTVGGIIFGVLLILAGIFNITDLIFLPLILAGGSPRQRVNKVELFHYLHDELAS
jgi:hypothetical protein